MFPIYNDKLYTIDIEVRPLPQYDDCKYDKDNEYKNDDEIEIEEPNFYPWCCEIYGLALNWGLNYEEESIYFSGNDIEKVIKILSKEKIKLGAHNVFFDWVNIYYHYGVSLNFVSDSGVVSQCINNSDFINSFGLKETTERLYNIITQDVLIKDYLKDYFKIPASKYGKYIHLCPIEIIEKYCRLDAHYCWKIIHDSNKWLKSDISGYMKIYISEIKMTIIQFIEGILINKNNFEYNNEIIKKQINEIESKFFNHPELISHIESVQIKKFNLAQSKLKTKKLDFNEWNKKLDNKFNINSTKQLRDLFDSQRLHWNEDKNKFEYPYLNVYTGTKVNNPDSPKLGTKFLHAYGIGGEILADKGEKKTLSQHIDRILTESALDGKIHPHLNLLGTKSGRISGSGVNIIATPISDPLYGKNLICEEGWSIVCRDFKSLEPTLLACFSNDPVLRYSTYEGEGKEPFIKDDILWIDDIYIMSAYSAPFMRTEIEDKLDLTNWIKNSDLEKRKIKLLRSLSKSIVLSTNYGAGPLKVQSKIREDLKITIPLKNIISFQENYWATLSIAAQYKRYIENEAQKKGYLVNIGGYPLTFYDRPGGLISGVHKALNKMLQSSANICMKLIIHYLYPKIRNRKDMIPQVTDWHDAFFFKVHNDSINEFISISNDALEMVNNTLMLPLKLRLDFNKGNNFYDCKQ